MAQKSRRDSSGQREYVIAVGGPKGGVGKSTILCILIMLLHRTLVRMQSTDRLLAVDAAADNHNTYLYLAALEQYLPQVDVGQADDPDTLRGLRLVPGYLLKGIDLPGGLKSGELNDLLTPNERGELGADLLIIPTAPGMFDIESLMPAIEDIIRPSGIPYGVVLSRVQPRGLAAAVNIQGQLAAQGVDVFRSMIRQYSGVSDAQGARRPLPDWGGRHDPVRAAEDDMRSLTREVVQRLGMPLTIPTRAQEYEEARNGRH